ncbi:MAG: LytTR family DNA-binding domain-containing protein [Chryseolinea sp.]
MRKVRCIIVEDEKPAQEILKSFIAKTDWLELTGVFDDGVSALDFLNKNDVDLIFLDIQIPLINGMDFLKILRNPPDIIITTAYSEYAIGAFELEVMDYLKKPFSFERFLKAVNRINVQKENSAAVQPTTHSEQDFAFFNVNKTMTKVMFEDILYVESMREYIYLHTSKGKIITKMSTHEIEKILGSNFLRIHRSFIVNISKVAAFNAEEIFVDVKNLPIGVSYKKQVESVFRKHVF